MRCLIHGSELEVYAYCCLASLGGTVLCCSLRKVSFRRDLSMQALAVKAKQAISLIQLSQACYSVQVSIQVLWRHVLASTACKHSSCNSCCGLLGVLKHALPSVVVYSYTWLSCLLLL
jgi:hypothetical protein